MQTVFHAEISHSISGHVLFAFHVSFKLCVHILELLHKFRIVFQLLITVQRNGIQQHNRIMTAFSPFLNVDHAEQSPGLVVPAPPKVLRQFFQSNQFLRNRTVNHNTDPAGIINRKLFFDIRHRIVNI